MKLLKSTLLSLLLISSQAAFAGVEHEHGGEHGHDHDHGHSMNATQALTLGADVAKFLTEKDAGLEIGQLPESWASIPQEQLSMFKQGQGYYIVAVENIALKKTLYVLMSVRGEAYDANFTGDFPSLQ